MKNTNKKMKVKKRFVTLIEMMIVMFLIALIIGVVAYNYRGSLDEGKAFKTRIAISKIENILDMIVSEDPSAMDGLSGNWEDLIKKSPLVQNPESLVRDGWGGKFQISTDGGVIQVHSDKYDDYQRTHQTMFGEGRNQQ